MISSVLAFALLLTALTLIFRERIVARYAPRLSTLPPKRIAALTVIVGGLLGVLVSISSVGAGAIGVTAVVLLYPKLPTARIVGSDIVHAVPLTLVAGIGHWFLGSIDLAGIHHPNLWIGTGNPGRQLCRRPLSGVRAPHCACRNAARGSD